MASFPLLHARLEQDLDEETAFQAVERLHLMASVITLDATIVKAYEQVIAIVFNGLVKHAIRLREAVRRLSRFLGFRV